MEVKIAPFIHDMKNLFQNISLAGNSFVDVPPTCKNESHKMLAIFYRTACKTSRATSTACAASADAAALDQPRHTSRSSPEVSRTSRRATRSRGDDYRMVGRSEGGAPGPLPETAATLEAEIISPVASCHTSSTRGSVPASKSRRRTSDGAVGVSPKV